MKHPATTRPVDALMRRIASFLNELCVRARSWGEGLRSPGPSVESAVTIDLENILTLDDRHGAGAGDHAVRLMARALEEETGSDDFVARTGPTTFAVVVRGADREAAGDLVDRVRVRFDELLYDAGYECDVAMGESPLSVAPEVEDLIDRSHLPRVTMLPSSAIYLN